MGFTDSLGATHLLRRIDTRSLIVAAQTVLVLILAMLTARLIWAAFAPIGPIGKPPASAQAESPVDATIFSRFDPFFQMLGDNPVVVSDLAIDLFGTRVDNVSGRGSAIIGVDGTQRSFMVGEELMPGVTLHSVAFDSVTVSRNGALEQLFLDQSVPAQPVSPPAETAEASVPPEAPAEDVRVKAGRISQEIMGEPLLKNGKLEGIALRPAGNGELFNEIGLKAGDILLSVNGATITDMKTPPTSIQDLLGDANVAALEIRRGAQVQTVTFEITR